MADLITEQDKLETLQRAERAKRHVQGWKDNIKRWRRLYDMKHYTTKAKANEIQFSDPTYTNTVDLSVGIMLGNKLRWHAFGFKPSHQEQQGTSQVEKLIDATLAINDEREEINQLYQLYLHFCRDGGAAIYSVFDPKLADKNEEEIEIPDEQQGSITATAFKEIPLRVQVIDPESVIALPGGPKRWLAIGRTEARSVLDIESLYGVRLEQYVGYTQDQKAEVEGEFIDLWDYVYKEVPLVRDGEEVQNDVIGKTETNNTLLVRNTIFYMGKPIIGPRIMDGYTELPYTVQFFKPTSKDPGDWQSIIQPLESSVALLERTFNRRAHQIDIYTGLPIVIKSQPGRAVRVDTGLYNQLSITPDESVEFPVWPGNAPDVAMHIDFLRSRVQQSGFSDVMFGSGVNQVAGYALSQLGDQNRIRLEQPIAHLELLLTHWAKKALKLLNEFASDTYICIYGQHKGKDYFEYVPVNDLSTYSVRAEIRPSFPNEETRKTAMATQVKGMISNYTIMEKYLGIEQPDDEEERKIIEAVSNHPVLIQYMVNAELQKRADAGDEIAKKTLAQIENGQIAGTPGRPDQGNKPEQLIGTQSATGQPVPQAGGGSPPGQSAIEQANAASNAAPNMQGMVQ